MKDLKVGVLFVLLFACAGVNECTQPADPNSGDDCGRACDNLQRLQCEEGRGSPGRDNIPGTSDDVSCVQVCRDVEAVKNVTMFPACLATVKRCSEVDRCSNGGI